MPGRISFYRLMLTEVSLLRHYGNVCLYRFHPESIKVEKNIIEA